MKSLVKHNCFSKSEINDKDLFYISFWTLFKEYLQEQNISNEIPYIYKPSNHNWYNVSFGISKYHIVLKCTTKQQSVSIAFYISDDKLIFDELFTKKHLIEQTFGYSFKWKSHNNNKSSVISVSKSFNEFENFVQCFDWFIIEMGKIFSIFRSLIERDYCIFPETDCTQICIEGAKTTIEVNKYERSSIARQKCIDGNGCYCHVCGLNFQERYGDIGKDFIHVHHKIPLNEIQEEYVVDPINDLVPVCPNCHAMLHRKIDNRYLSIDELKALLK